jgi:hypothetical protein
MTELPQAVEASVEIVIGLQTPGDDFDKWDHPPHR